MIKKVRSSFPEIKSIPLSVNSIVLFFSSITKNNSKNEKNLSVEIDAEVFKKAIIYSDSSISPIAAFFGGIVAQEIVKFTGKYSPLK
jgi:hypothetical protein